MKSKQLDRFLFAIQGIGIIFYGVFSAAYILALPSNHLLSGEPVFHVLLSIFGGLFFLLTIAAIAVSVTARIEE